MPIILIGPPESNLDDYNVFEIKPIAIYIVKNLQTQNEIIHISLSKLFKWEKLSLEGAKIL